MREGYYYALAFTSPFLEFINVAVIVRRHGTLPSVFIAYFSSLVTQNSMESVLSKYDRYNRTCLCCQ